MVSRNLFSDSLLHYCSAPLLRCYSRRLQPLSKQHSGKDERQHRQAPVRADVAHAHGRIEHDDRLHAVAHGSLHAGGTGSAIAKQAPSRRHESEYDPQQVPAVLADDKPRLDSRSAPAQRPARPFHPVARPCRPTSRPRELYCASVRAKMVTPTM